ncbi:MAG TPA: MFS transporter [Candidatus Thermoplasmatota archaeon]|nr:MFS transporter [Candidatus Thermoplasmatota archaeon]
MPSDSGRWRHILLLVVVNAFVGGMVGLERTLLPLLAESEYGVASAAAAFSFIVTFGLSKAFVNLAAGSLADRFGRRRVLLAGWLAGIPVPLVVLFAPSWGYIVAANALLGVNQGLAWSMTVNMKLDRARADERGLVVGLNEAAGYLGVAALAFVTALYATREAMGALGLGLALAGLLLSLLARDAERPAARRGELARAFRDRAFAAPSVAGLATNLKDGALWGLLPLALAARGLDLATIGAVVAAYPVAWGLGQLAFGPFSDRVGRRGLAVVGLALQAAGVAALALAPGAAGALAAAIVVGLGTAMAYPTLLALVADRARPQARATALGVYRFWRDLGYAAGAVGAGVVADAAGFGAALLSVAAFVALAALPLHLSREG